MSVEISLYFQRGTENRLSVLHHEVGKCSTSSTPQPILISLPPPPSPVPNYLRTKLDLDLELKQKRLLKEAKEKESSLKEEITTYNSIIKSCLKIVSDAREDMEDQKSRIGLKHFY